VDIETIKDEISLKSNGDLKGAINQLYLYSLKGGSRMNNKPRKIKSLAGTQYSQSSWESQSGTIDDSQEKTKDREFTLFHTLGKFLYNKSIIFNDN